MCSSVAASGYEVCQQRSKVLDAADCCLPHSRLQIFSCISPSLSLCLMSLHTHTHTHSHTHDICSVTLTVSHICSLDRMDRAPLRMESRLLSRYMASLEHTHTHAKTHTHTHAKTHTCDSNIHASCDIQDNRARTWTRCTEFFGSVCVKFHQRARLCLNLHFEPF